MLMGITVFKVIYLCIIQLTHNLASGLSLGVPHMTSERSYTSDACQKLWSWGLGSRSRVEEKTAYEGLPEEYIQSGSLDQWFLTFLKSCFSLKIQKL